MPVSRANPPTGQQVPPSSISIGKKPMSYPANPSPAATPQVQPKSARAASKAPVHNQQTQQGQPQQNRHPSPPTSNSGGTAKARAIPAPASNSGPTAAQKGKANANKIWSTSTTEERERIKDFWLGLGEQERRNLVKIEKDTVLRKMKEQQKHSCSCAVCGRKRNAIEEELEVLYDAYYEELEQYANYQQRYVSSGGTIPPPPGPGPFPGSVELDKNGAVVAPVHPNPKRAAIRSAKHQHPPQHPPQTLLPPVTNGRKPHHPHVHQHHHPPADDDDGEYIEHYDEEDEEEEEEEEEEPEEEEEEEEEEEDEEDDGQQPNPKAQARRAPPQANGRRTAPSKGRDGLFNIGSSLTVTGPGNILTVADDLLKNDGQKFLEMMEQLAERRMQREEEAAIDVEDESEEESEDDRDGSEADDDGDEDAPSEEDDDDDEEDDEEEPMTEEQKMEEGKHMFSIFAARMFEQRVLTAYREKVAQERQLQLLRELEEEDKSTRDREMKKQTQNQKKKDKKRQQKLAKEEEKAAKTAEKAAEEAATKAKQLAQEEENRKKREEERQRREAAKKLAEEERLRKEEEKKKRQQEERERELEREKKKREKEERLKKEREEKERKAKEEREARLAKEREERVERERIEKEKKEEREKVEKEKRLAKEKEEKAEKEAKDKLAAQQRAAAIAQAQATMKAPVRTNATASSSTSSLATSTKSSSVSVHSVASGTRAQNSPAVTTNGGLANGKKVINNKHVPTPSSTMPSSGPVGQVQQRPHPLPVAPQQMQQQPPNISRPHHLPPIGNMNPQQIPSHLPPQSGMMFGHPQGPVMIPPPALSPRVNNFSPMQYQFNPANMQHHPPPGTPITPSGLSRGFNAGPPYDQNFNRGMPMPIGVPLPGSVNIPSAAPSPIGPPKPKTPMVSTNVPAPPMLAPGQGRRGSMVMMNNQSDTSISGPGPITRPIAPIARPITGGGGEGAASSGSGSPSRRSPSPKGILGSSALAADDDEVLSTTGQRRVGAIGVPMSSGMPSLQNWAPTSPRPGQSWGGSGPPGFSPSPARPIPTPIGTNNHLHQLHHPGVSPIGGGSLWAANSPATNGGDNWHPQGHGGFFPGPAYISHNSAASSTPHTSS